MLVWLGRSPESFVPGHPGADLPEAQLPRLKPPMLLRFDIPGIHALLDVQRGEREMTWTQVARAVGGIRATPAALQGMRTQSRTGFPHIMRIARWLERPCVALTRVASW